MQPLPLHSARTGSEDAPLRASLTAGGLDRVGYESGIGHGLTKVRRLPTIGRPKQEQPCQNQPTQSVFDKKKRRLVPLAGIEPALLAEHDFESRASTNSATGARRSKTSRRAGLYRRGAFGQWRSCASPRHRARTERAWSDPQPDRVHHSSVFGMVWESRLGYQGAPADRPQIVSCDKVPPSSPCVGGLVGGRYG